MPMQGVMSFILKNFMVVIIYEFLCFSAPWLTNNLPLAQVATKAKAKS